MTYHKSKLYRKLDDIPTFKWDDYSKEDLETFKLAGELNTLPFAIFTPVVRYNETVATADGVTIPAEGPGWTWDSLAELLVAYSKNNPASGRVRRTHADHDLTFEAWLRQRGEQLWTQDGQVGFTVDGLGSWLDWWEKLRKAGAALSLSEQEGMGPDWAQVGKKVLVNFGNSNHIIDDAKMFPKERFRLRAAPIAPTAVDGHKYLYFPRMAIYQRIDDANLEAAGKVLDYNVNNPEMLKTVRLTMGAPTNPKVAEQAQAFASQDEKEMLALVQKERAAQRKPRYEAPPGSSTWRTATSRICEEIALGRTTVPDGAKKLVDEIAAGIKQSTDDDKEACLPSQPAGPGCSYLPDSVAARLPADHRRTVVRVAVPGLHRLRHPATRRSGPGWRTSSGWSMTTQFWASVRVTLVYVLVSVPLQLGVRACCSR